MEDAKGVWGEKKSLAEAKLKAYDDSHKNDIDALRAKLADEVKAVNEAIGAKKAQQDLIDA